MCIYSLSVYLNIKRVSCKEPSTAGYKDNK